MHRDARAAVRVCGEPVGTRDAVRRRAHTARAVCVTRVARPIGTIEPPGTDRGKALQQSGTTRRRPRSAPCRIPRRGQASTGRGTQCSLSPSRNTPHTPCRTARTSRRLSGRTHPRTGHARRRAQRRSLVFPSDLVHRSPTVLSVLKDALLDRVPARAIVAVQHDASLTLNELVSQIGESSIVQGSMK